MTTSRNERAEDALVNDIFIYKTMNYMWHDFLNICCNFSFMILLIFDMKDIEVIFLKKKETVVKVEGTETNFFLLKKTASYLYCNWLCKKEKNKSFFIL